MCLVALAPAARAEDPPAAARPFLTGNEDGVLAVTGAFGPAKDTILVFTYDMHLAGSYHGFALVPDRKAAHGYRKLALPALPDGAELGTDQDGQMKAALVANLDKHPGDELVLQLAIVCCPGAQGTWMGVTYIVLHWDGHRFVRVAALEKALARAVVAKDAGQTQPLTDAELRAALRADGKPR